MPIQVGTITINTLLKYENATPKQTVYQSTIKTTNLWAFVSIFESTFNY